MLVDRVVADVVAAGEGVSMKARGETPEGFIKLQPARHKPAEQAATIRANEVAFMAFMAFRDWLCGR
jgi:hypothetical protein